MSLKFDLFPIRPLTAARFWSWLARTVPGAALEYHRGLLVLDRSPASELKDEERRTVAKLADAALQAAEEGRVHLVQRRNGDFDFSYFAIKAAPARGKRAAGSLSDAGGDLPAAA
jgi:rhodanese-related sulfurtransferase